MGPTSPIDSLEKVIHRSRKILCTAALLAALLGGAAKTAGARPVAGRGRAELPVPQRAGLSQAGRRLVLTIRTSAPVPLAQLARFPEIDAAGARYLCAELSKPGSGGLRRLCLGGPSDTRRAVGLELVNADGRTIDKKTVAARVKRADATKLTLSLLPSDASLPPRRYRWRVLEGLGECEPAGGTSCQRSLPASGRRTFRLRPVRAVGCTGGTAGWDTNGPRGRKTVALTFDDGPSEYTPGFLRVLRDEHATGTFFEIGQEMAGREATMRRILGEGDEIGNHTMHHGFYPGYADLAATSARIEAITHFKPCLFRPPGGALDSSVIAAAGEAGMRTITWDVDPTDWANPGSGAVYSRVVGAAQPGSIILMHDGGGDRSGTLAALPSIIDTLRARGYRFATVTALLGQRLLYKPYG